MKIYLLYEYGGMYEDAYNKVIGVFLKKENADKEKKEKYKVLPELKKQTEKCVKCVEQERKSCYKPFVNDDGGIFCDNEVSSFIIPRGYRVVKYDVSDCISNQM